MGNIMPSIITHELFAREALKTVPAALKNTILNYPKEFSIGSSGPDLFFYYNAWPWLSTSKENNINKLGSLIHNQNIKEFFKEAFIQVKYHPTPAKLSYLCGFLCHWALDKQTHPYIFNQTGDTHTKKGMNAHRLFESHLDYLTLKQYRNCSVAEYPSYRLLEFDEESIAAIFQFYKTPVKQVFNFDLSKLQVKKSLSHFEGIQRFLFDPYHIKSKLLEMVESAVIKNPYAFSSMIVPEKEDVNDILNLEHRPWHHPCTNEEYTDSFIDLFQQALRVVDDVLLVLDYYLKGRCSLDQLLQLINNQSFETGLPTETPMIYFDIQ